MAYLTYTYTRTALSGDGYDINNSNRLDGSGNQIWLAREIESVFPTKKFIVRCNGTVLTILVLDTDDFSTSEKTTLDQIVSDHRNNV